MREEQLVADERTLVDVCETVAAAAVVAIDTEFVRERTYYPELCLLQIGTEGLAACVDCLATLDLAPLLAALERRDCCWVLHSARQDLEVLWNLGRATPARLVDTQIAAALLGFSPQLGLQGLLAELLDIRLDKGHTRTDWSRRPLPEAALRYALDDVRYLLPAWRELHARLAALERLEWFAEDCKRLLAEPPVADGATILRRLKAAGGLSRREQCAALELIEWRERRAREANRPRRWILTDEHLVSICRAQPASVAELRALTDLPRGVVAHSGAEILAAIEASGAADRRAAVESLLFEHRPDKSAVASLQSLVKRRAAELGIHAEVLATRRDINALAAGADPQSVLSGWRARALKLA